jgi:hypothetical protein
MGAEEGDADPVRGWPPFTDSGLGIEFLGAETSLLASRRNSLDIAILAPAPR